MPININIYHSHWSSAAANHLGNEVSSLDRWIKIIQYRRHQTVQTMNSCPQGVSSIYLLHGSPLRKIEFPKGQWCLARVEKTSGGTRLVRGGWEGHFNLHFSDQFSLNIRVKEFFKLKYVITIYGSLSPHNQVVVVWKSGQPTLNY